MRKPLTPEAAAIHESFTSWLAQHGYAIVRAADTQYPLSGTEFERSTRELANNATQAVLLVQDERSQEVGGCLCGAKFFDTAAVDDHECPLAEAA